jgi:two-component system, NtrC family, response regulator
VVPPVRARPEDIPAIISDWARRPEHANAPRPVLSAGALALVQAHPWPGNVRELLGRLTSAGTVAAGRVIRPDDLTLRDWPARADGREPSSNGIKLRDVEHEAIHRALARTGGNIVQAAAILGISRSTLYRRLRAYRLIGR